MRKIWKQAIAWLIIFTLILSAGCTPTEPEATVPSDTVPSLPPQSTEQIGIYTNACQAAQTAGKLVLDFRFSETRVIAGESFEKSGIIHRDGKIIYLDDEKKLHEMIN